MAFDLAPLVSAIQQEALANAAVVSQMAKFVQVDPLTGAVKIDQAGLQTVLQASVPAQLVPTYITGWNQMTQGGMATLGRSSIPFNVIQHKVAIVLHDQVHPLVVRDQLAADVQLLVCQ